MAVPRDRKGSQVKKGQNNGFYQVKGGNTMGAHRGGGGNETLRATYQVHVRYEVSEHEE